MFARGKSKRLNGAGKTMHFNYCRECAPSNQAYNMSVCPVGGSRNSFFHLFELIYENINTDKS